MSMFSGSELVGSLAAPSIGPQSDRDINLSS